MDSGGLLHQVRSQGQGRNSGLPRIAPYVVIRHSAQYASLLRPTSCIYSISTHTLSCTPNDRSDPSTLGRLVYGLVLVNAQTI